MAGAGVAIGWRRIEVPIIVVVVGSRVPVLHLLTPAFLILLLITILCVTVLLLKRGFTLRPCTLLFNLALMIRSQALFLLDIELPPALFRDLPFLPLRALLFLLIPGLLLFACSLFTLFLLRPLLLLTLGFLPLLRGLLSLLLLCALKLLALVLLPLLRGPFFFLILCALLLIALVLLPLLR